MNDSAASSGAQVFAASISTGTMAFLGLPSLALTWAFIGAICALILTPPETKGMALLRIGASGILGAGLGYAASKWIGGGDASIIACCALLGAAGKQVLTTIIPAGLEAAKRAMEKWSQQ